MKNKILKYDFLVVGGGLIGALAAFALHKKNYKILVIDKNNCIMCSFSHTSSSLVLHVAVVTVLLGAGAAVEE